MIDRPKNHEDALDIVWAIIRSENQAWMSVFPDTQGCTVRDVVRETGWAQTTVYRLVNELLELGQLTRKWNHQHQSFWNMRLKTENETPLPQDKAVSDIPF